MASKGSDWKQGKCTNCRSKSSEHDECLRNGLSRAADAVDAPVIPSYMTVQMLQRSSHSNRQTEMCLPLAFVTVTLLFFQKLLFLHLSELADGAKRFGEVMRDRQFIACSCETHRLSL